MSVSLFVCIQINVKTTESIGPKFCVGPHVTPGEVNEWTKIQKFVLKCFIFVKNIMKSANFFCFCFKMYKEKMVTDKATIKSWKPSIPKSEQNWMLITYIDKKTQAATKNLFVRLILKKHFKFQRWTQVTKTSKKSLLNNLF